MNRITVILAISTTAVAQAFCQAEKLQFNRDIRPILSNACFKCHGPDSNAREADLRLDVEAAAKHARDNGAAIVSGKPEQSELIRRIESGDTNVQMPPADSGLKLSKKELSLLKQWITEGAAYQRHWSLEPIQRPDFPKEIQSLPIDWLVTERAKQSGLKLLGAASPETQIRRVSLDLTGLPPTLEELDFFLANVKKIGLNKAYEREVDRLLQSPRHAERMAWQWLEAARYADTDGYQNDGPRDMWRWRDWVIEAYQAGMPFNQFTIEQIAGDLLPNRTIDQWIATGFNRNNRYNSEAGIPIDEFLLENAVDRVDTTATVWMGMTFGCARCHDHKYDPISQKEYYQLIDFFNDVAESGRAIKFGNSEPWIKAPTKEQQQQLSKLDATLADARNKLDAMKSKIAEQQTKWEKAKVLNKPIVRLGLNAYFDFETQPKRLKVTQGMPVRRLGLRGKAATVGGQGSFNVGKIPGLIGNGRFSIAFWLKPEAINSGAVLSNEAASTTRNGILVEFVDGHLRWNIIHRWISGVSTVETKRQLEADKWVHVTLTNDGTQRAQGMLVYLDGKLAQVKEIRNTNSNAAGKNQGIGLSIGHSKHVGFWKGQLDELRCYSSRTLAAVEADLLAEPLTVEQILDLQPSDRSERQTQVIRTAFLEHAASTEVKEAFASVQQAAAARTKLYDKLPTTMVMSDRSPARPSHIRIRGVYDRLGEQVSGNVPSVFPALPQGRTKDRLAFAKWLVNDRHPLTPRVTVNRYWQLLFGRGIVNTPEDFGSQGSAPSHPKLLDYLAAELRDSGWNTRQLLKQIVMSQTYRRDSRVLKDHLEKDPNNVWLARAPRRRLPGNVLRDQAFFVSGLLVEKIGGPSVYPYQPPNLWREASNMRYKLGKGEDLYRRSLYTYWKRTLAPPSMALLDAADREWCSVKPKQTNTPLQALTLLNEVTFHEAAQKLGDRMLSLEGPIAARIATTFRMVTSRSPKPDERKVLEQAFATYRKVYTANNELAKQAGGKRKKGDKERDPVERASATALANVLLNLDEVTTRE